MNLEDRGLTPHHHSTIKQPGEFGPMSPRTKRAGHPLMSAEQIEVDWVYKLGRRNLRARADDFKFRLNVVAPTVADVVSCVGGWLVDRAMMGWDIKVLIAQTTQDFRPLNILGVTPLSLETVLDGRTRLPICDGISVAADLYFGDGRVRRHVLRRLHRRQSEKRPGLAVSRAQAAWGSSHAAR